MLLLSRMSGGNGTGVDEKARTGRQGRPVIEVVAPRQPGGPHQEEVRREVRHRSRGRSSQVFSGSRIPAARFAISARSSSSPG
jgi:hypothetical protein